MGEAYDDDINIQLLRDIREVFGDDLTFIGSKELAQRLAALDSRPWGDWNKGKVITTRGVASRLERFGIVPVRNTQATTRGYHRDRFEDAWARYFPGDPQSYPSTRQEASENGGGSANSICQYGDRTDTSKVRVSPINTARTDVLTDRAPDIEAGRNSTVVSDTQKPEPAEEADVARF